MVSSLVTKKKIAKAFKHQFVNQPFDKISIRSLMEEAGIRRQTFYNHFIDKYDLLEWIFQTELSEQITDNLEYISGYELIVELLEFFQTNREFYAKLFQITGQNDFSTYFEVYCQQIMEKVVAEYGGNSFKTEKARQLFISYHSLALANLIKHHLTSSQQSQEALDSEAIIDFIKVVLEKTKG